jgi:hypothetical protein
MRCRSEKARLNDILVGVTALSDTMAWRNNTGTAWQGDRCGARVGSTVRVEAGMVILRDARPIKFGLTGSADIIGAHRGFPLAVEVKDEEGRQTEVQYHFERAWRKAGGLYILARTPDEAIHGIRDAALLG